MPKRKKPQISVDESLLLKSKKTPRIGNINMNPKNSEMKRYFNLEDSEIATVTKQDGEESSQKDISSLDESTDTPTKEPRQPIKDTAPSSFSQNSEMKFVPVFAQSKKSLMQKTVRKEKTQIMLTESNHQKAKTVQFDEPLVTALQEDRELEDQKPKGFLITEIDGVDGEEQDSQSLLKSTDESHYITVSTFNNTPQEIGSIIPVQERTNKKHLSEEMTNTLNGKNPESKNLESGSFLEMEMNSTPVYENLDLSSHSQKEEAHLSSNASIIQQNRPLPDRRTTHESDITQEEVETSTTYGLIGGLDGDDLPERQGKKEESSLSIISSDSNLSTAGEQSTDQQKPWDKEAEQECPDNVPQSNKTNQNVKLSLDSQRSRMSRQECLSCSCPLDTDLKINTDISESKERTQVTRSSQPINKSFGVPSFFNIPYAEKEGKDREEASHEGEPSQSIRVVSNHSTSIVSAPKDLIPKIEHKDTVALILEKENLYPNVEQKQMTTRVDEKEANQLLGTRLSSPWLINLVDDKEPGLGIISGSSEQNFGLKESSLSVNTTTCLSIGKEIIADPVKETETNMNSRKFPAEKIGLPENECNFEDHTDWGESLALELDFLPDSQIRDALDDLNFGFPSEQIHLEELAEEGEASPMDGMLVSSLPGKNPHSDEQVCSKAPLTLKSTSSHNKLQPRYEMAEGSSDPPKEDATTVICGLIVELSNLNRLIMSTHRDLESFKRLKHRKGKVAGKQSHYQFPYPPKGVTHCSQAMKKWKEK